MSRHVLTCSMASYKCLRTLAYHIQLMYKQILTSHELSTYQHLNEKTAAGDIPKDPIALLCALKKTKCLLHELGRTFLIRLTKTGSESSQILCRVCRAQRAPGFSSNRIRAAIACHYSIVAIACDAMRSVGRARKVGLVRVVAKIPHRLRVEQV
jgi:hypothetical protein